jgi:hypothetical protein
MLTRIGCWGRAWTLRDQAVADRATVIVRVAGEPSWRATLPGRAVSIR